MFTKELIQSKIRNSFKNATGKDLDLSKLKVYSRTLIENITALVEAFPNSAIYPLKTTDDRKTFGYAHITVKVYDDDYSAPAIGYYVTTSLEIAYPTHQSCVYTLKLREELIDEWRHGYIPGIILFHSTESGIPFYKVIKPEEVKSMVFNYNADSDSEVDGRGYRWANLKCKDTNHNPIPDFIDETKTPFNFDYVPSFMKIANVQYAKFRNYGTSYIVTGYFNRFAEETSFTFRSSREAAASLQKLGIKISYKTLMRHMKSGTPIKVDNTTYDYIVISDKRGPDVLEETAIKDVKVFNPSSGKEDTVKVRTVDTTAPDDVDISDISGGIIDLDTDEIYIDRPLQEVVIEKSWDYPTIYEQPPKVSKEDVILREWLKYRKDNPGKSYNEFIAQFDLPC